MGLHLERYRQARWRKVEQDSVREVARRAVRDVGCTADAVRVGTRVEPAEVSRS